MLKKILKFILILLPWGIGGLVFKANPDYYNSLNLPSFALPSNLFFPVWTILYILISISIYIVLESYSLKDIKEYKNSLLINYIFNQLYTFFFFTLKSPFLGFVDVAITFITSLFLYYETKELSKKASLFLLPYVFFTLFATILNISIYFMNL